MMLASEMEVEGGLLISVQGPKLAVMFLRLASKHVCTFDNVFS